MKEGMTQLEKLTYQGLQLSLSRLEIMMQTILENQKQEKKDEEAPKELPEWITLRQAVTLKGSGSYSTYKCKKDLQPLCGIPEGKVCGLKAWKKETVLEWLTITDDQLESYKKRSFEKMSSKNIRLVG